MRVRLEGPSKGNWAITPWPYTGISRCNGIWALHFGFLLWFFEIELRKR